MDDLLLSLQLEPGEFTFQLRPGDLSPVVARATSDVQAATGRAIELDLPFDLPGVLVDEDQDRLFQPFSRLRPDTTSGTGLGLYIARELVVGQGGEIWVTSDDEATTFSYSLVKAPSDT